MLSAVICAVPLVPDGRLHALPRQPASPRPGLEAWRRSNDLARCGRGRASLHARAAHSLTPERLYLRRWETTLLDLSLDRLRQEMAEDGKASLFEELKSSLLADDTAEPPRRCGLCSLNSTRT